MVKGIVITLVLLLLPIVSFAWTATVASVKDGDTIDIIRKGKTVTITLYGIDCPEENQPYGGRAKSVVSGMLRKQTIEIEPVSTDPEGGVLALVYVNGECLNRTLVEKGLAWLDHKNCQREICIQWNELQLRAQMDRAGLWVREDAIPPWQWRAEAH